MSYLYIVVEQLSILTITSKAMRNLIEGFRVLKPMLHKELMYRLHAALPFEPIPIEKQSDYLRVFSRLGKIKL